MNIFIVLCMSMKTYKTNDDYVLILTMHLFSLLQMRCGNNHTIFLTEHGHVYTMGQNDHGQLGIGNHLEKVLSL